MTEYRYRLRELLPVLIIALIPVLNLEARATEPARLTYTVTLDASDVSMVNRNGKTAVRVNDERFSLLLDEGMPALPYRVVNLVLPQGEVVERVVFTAGEEGVLRERVEVEVAPAIVSEDGLAGSGGALAPASGGAFPAAYGKYLGTGYLHGYAIASVAVFPIVVSGDDLHLARKVTVEVHTRTGDPEMEVVSRERFVDGFRSEVGGILRFHTVNPGDAAGYVFDQVRVDRKKRGFQPTSFPSLEGSPVEYVIITTDEMAAAYQVLADWKTDKGVPAVVRTVEWIQANYRNGSDLQETIRNFIKEAYAKWGVTYVLLGGDAEQVPARLGASFYLGTKIVPADLYYACLDGDWNADHDEYFGEGGSIDNPDLYAEVYAGRLPSRNSAEAALLVSKIQSYESTTNSEYTSKILMLSEVLYPYDWRQGEPYSMNGADFSEDVYNSCMSDPDLNVIRMYETPELYPGAVPETRSAAIDSIETGVNFVNHIGHGFRFNMSVGDASIVNSDADALTNSPGYGNYFLLNCTAVAFTYYCLAEHFLVNPNGGAVSTVGANESAFPILSSQYMDAYYDILFNQNITNIGKTFAMSRLPRTALATSADNADLWTHYIYTILADPEMPLWTDVVKPMDVSHVSNVSLGTSPITVIVTSGGPVGGAMVCLTKGTDDYQYGTTNGSGEATFNFRAESPGQIKVVVTAHNRARYEGTITVDSTSAAYVSVNGVTVDDDNIGGTTGNGDGMIDAGETVDLLLEMVNSGGSASGVVDVIMSTAHPAVTMLDDTASVGAVAAGGTTVAADPLRLTIAAGTSDETAVAFDVTVNEDGVSKWADEFTRLVHAPVLDLVTLRIDDSVSGNGNGVVDANEEFALYYGLKNYGTGTANGLGAAIADLDGGFIITIGGDVYPDVTPMAKEENIGGFILEEMDVSTEHDLEITIIDSWGRAYVDTFELRPPDPPDSLTFDASLGSDRLNVKWQSSTGAARYNVFQSETPGGPYTLINADPVDHTVFLATGLSPSTRYYFKTTAVDSSGNQSAQSAEFAGSTNPPQLEGWPISMKRETVSSPVVGDIDGDGDLEIVQGDDKVYAWHHDGVEMYDADGNAQTWGVLSTAGDEYVSAIALALVDEVPGAEIVAASRNTKEVYVMNHEGTVLPGWPQPVENYIRAGMVVGDINDDDVNEIIAVDEHGVLYVWNANGTEFIDGDGVPSTPGVFYRLPGNTILASTPAVADIDGDGKKEIVAGSESSELYVFNDDGSSVPGFPLTLAAPVSGSPAVGDLDDNGDLEIVVNQKFGVVIVCNHDGSTLWSRWFPNNITFGPSPALADITGDGKLETIIPSSNGNLYAVRYDRNFVPGWPVQYSSTTYTESSPVISDLDGDGSLDIVLGDESKLIKAWDASGNLIDGFPVSTGDAMRGVPVICDLDRDGDADLVAAGWDQTVYAWDFPGDYLGDFVGWPSFHHNQHNDGFAGSVIATGVGGVSFSFEATPGGGVSLTWQLPPTVGYRFDIQRAVASGDDGAEVGEFSAVASGLTVEAGGMLRFQDDGARMGERYVYRVVESEGEAWVHTTGAVYVPVTQGSLSQNYPNPFNPTTTIGYLVPDGGVQRVRLVVYDVTGARVRTLVDKKQAGGSYTVEWDGRNDHGQAVGSGMYFYRLVEREYTKTRKMLLLK